MKQVLVDAKYNENDVEILEIEPVSQEEYIFIIYHRRLKFRFKIRGMYSVQTKEVIVKSVE